MVVIIELADGRPGRSTTPPRKGHLPPTSAQILGNGLISKGAISGDPSICRSVPPSGEPARSAPQSLSIFRDCSIFGLLLNAARLTLRPRHQLRSARRNCRQVGRKHANRGWKIDFRRKTDFQFTVEARNRREGHLLLLSAPDWSVLKFTSWI